MLITYMTTEDMLGQNRYGVQQSISKVVTKVCFVSVCGSQSVFERVACGNVDYLAFTVDYFDDFSVSSYLVSTAYHSILSAIIYGRGL